MCIGSSLRKNGPVVVEFMETRHGFSVTPRQFIESEPINLELFMQERTSVGNYHVLLAHYLSFDCYKYVN